MALFSPSFPGRFQRIRSGFPGFVPGQGFPGRSAQPDRLSAGVERNRKAGALSPACRLNRYDGTAEKPRPGVNRARNRADEELSRVLGLLYDSQPAIAHQPRPINRIRGRNLGDRIRMDLIGAPGQVFPEGNGKIHGLRL